MGWRCASLGGSGRGVELEICRILEPWDRAPGIGFPYGLEWLMGFLIVVFSRLPPSFHIFLSCPGGGADIERIRMGAPGMEFPHVLDRLVKFRFRVLFGAAVYHVFRFFIFKGGWKFNPWPIGHNPVYLPMVYPGRLFFPPHLFCEDAGPARRLK